MTRAFATDTRLLYSNRVQTVVMYPNSALQDKDAPESKAGKSAQSRWEKGHLEKSGAAFHGAKGAKTQPNSS